MTPIWVGKLAVPDQMVASTVTLWSPLSVNSTLTRGAVVTKEPLRGSQVSCDWISDSNVKFFSPTKNLDLFRHSHQTLAETYESLVSVDPAMTLSWNGSPTNIGTTRSTPTATPLAGFNLVA